MTSNIEKFVTSGLHAYLIRGDAEEALRFGRRYGKAFLCREEPKPCGACPSCRLFDAGEGGGANHPDYIEIAPTKKTAKASIKKESIASVLQEAAMASYMENGKVFLFRDFETATVEGQNALLKLLEDPPANTRFLLLSETGEGILPTILSRVGLIDIGDRQKTEGELRLRLFRTIEKVMRGPEEVFLARPFFDEVKDDLPEVFNDLESYLRDVAVVYETGEIERAVNADYRKMIGAHAEEMGERVYDIYDAAMKAAYYLEHNVNREFVLEWMFLQFGGTTDRE
ncbi:MAG: DNA polymerase III subunit delta' C-terminal domain-containing protein [Peptoniphilus sp.]|nr:DNA polymerase III subunit delta' C-terminal domain-containing protein [Peptoniphilus sp.]MDD7363161.1 DNA polymerase III subunit delta' C-terminal domain-containing protein [Bacillota bacterium]MDY6044515.1 DNA polymerase III subunit delta' C-terminal domain-containing protein [Peptoniphilus sp.]